MASEEVLTELETQEAVKRQRAFDERRFAVVSLTLPGLVKMLGNSGQDYFTFAGLPADTTFVAAHLDPYVSDQVWLRVASMEFAPVADGERAPDLLIEVTLHSREDVING